MEKDERLAKVETNVEWLVKTVAKMEPKLDHLIEKNSFQWGLVDESLNVVCMGPQ